MYESAKNELKENNKVTGSGYLFDVNISRVFFQNMNVTQAATPPAKWITHGYFVIELQTVKPVPTDQPALNILPPRQFCSLIGCQVKRPSNVAITFLRFAHSAYDMV